MRTQENHLKGPSQQSFYFNGFPGQAAETPAENVSQTNRPHFDQISDATKYVLNPNHLGKNARKDSTMPTPTTMPTPAQTQETVPPDSKGTPEMQNRRNLAPNPNQQNVIDEEDYQQSSRGHLGDSGGKTKAGHRNLGRQSSFKSDVNQSGDGLTDDEDRARPCKHFNMQKADFESKSEGTETASEGQQPS